MSNPLLTPETMERAAGRDERSSGWAAPSPHDAISTTEAVTDGPVTRWHGGLATASGAASATLTLLLVLVASATVTWFSVAAPDEFGNAVFPAGWVIGGVIVGLVAVMVSMFRPHLSKVAGTVYAIAEGVVLGAVSRAYETAYDGIVMQAVGATMGVFVVMLLLYRTGVIRVTARYRRVVMGAMLGLMAFYLVSFVIGIFGSMPSFISGASPTGILFSVFVAGLAAANLAIDFDTIEMAEREKMPAYMEWYCALGVLVTLVWLYLEILRLIAKLREN